MNGIVVNDNRLLKSCIRHRSDTLTGNITFSACTDEPSRLEIGFRKIIIFLKDAFP